MAALDMASYNSYLKENYKGQKLLNTVYNKFPFLGMVPKDQGYEGKYRPIPLQIGNSQGIGGNFGTAQGNASAPTLKAFDLTPFRQYSISYIDTLTIAASGTSAGAFKKVLDVAMASALSGLKNELSISIFNDGTGVIGQMTAAGIATGVFTLASTANEVNYEIGMALVISLTRGGNIVSGSGVGYVTNVNRSQGIITVSATNGGAPGTPTNWSAATAYYLTRQGNVNNVLSGIVGGWIPLTPPAIGDDWYGVDRSVDTRLSGVLHNGAGGLISEALIGGANKIAQEGGSPDTALLNFPQWSALSKELGAKRVYGEVSKGEISFRSLVIDGPTGPIDVVADRNVPVGYCPMLQLDTWMFCSMGDPFGLFDFDGVGSYLRVYNADQLELRTYSFSNLGCSAPGWNGLITLPPASF